ncbi:hypothetical protein CgunFtcFv8_024300 [Champsocephalus gunnari]|uniref:Uncharacterized protein n=1 Tax=Champsocephalus gunnari TaxID=52237 RepID=A0AAN8DE21_CHAGU|nr:hypothetical protein CgunFtcFv8_024300 [Champsocephalus gunnari]
MPDVKPPPPCDYLSSASPFDLLIDMEPCIANLPLSPDPLSSSFPRHRPSFPHYPGLPPYPLMARCNSSTLLTNLGLRYCRQGPMVRVRGGVRAPAATPQATGLTGAWRT